VTSGTPAVLATVHGGYYAAGTPREGWDHATPWMRRILQDVWELDLLVVEADFTLVGVNPGLDQFADLARDPRAAADDRAAKHGQALAARTAATITTDQTRFPPKSRPSSRNSTSDSIDERLPLPTPPSYRNRDRTLTSSASNTGAACSLAAPRLISCAETSPVALRVVVALSRF
jgi:hypothetical protein